jgi:hypothetical protein
MKHWLERLVPHVFIHILSLTKGQTLKGIMTHGETSRILGVSSTIHQKLTKCKKLIMDCQIEY